MRLWWDDDLDWLVNRDLFDRAPSYPAKANIARYEIILRNGGLYVDADFEWLRPLDPRYFTIDRVVVAPSTAGLLSNGLFGAPAGHPFLARLVANVQRSIAENPSAISQVSSGPRFFADEFDTWSAETGGEYRVIPRDVVYPYFVDKLERCRGPWSPLAVGVHHWSQGRSRRAVNRVREVGLDAAKRLAVRRAVRFARQGRRIGGPAPDDRARARFLMRVLEGSDTYIEVGHDTFAGLACGLLSEYGRVFTLDPDLPPGTARHTTMGGQ